MQKKKKKIVNNLKQTGKVVFSIFCSMFALKHCEYIPFGIIFVQAPQIN